MIELINNHKNEIRQICRRLDIRRLEVFGSAASGNFRFNQSDVDFIVEFNTPEAPPGLLNRYMALVGQLESVLNHKVDIITPQTLRNPYFRQSVEADKEVVYGQPGSQVSA